MQRILSLILAGAISACTYVPPTRTSQRDAQSDQRRVDHLWGEYQQLKDSIDIVPIIKNLYQTGNDSKISLATANLELLIKVTKDKSLECEQRQEILAYVNTTARQLLWAEHHYQPRDETVYDLAQLVGQTNFSHGCNGKTKSPVDSDLIRERNNRYHPSTDQQLWAQYTTLWDNLNKKINEDIVGSAFQDNSIQMLESMATIAENPALSCDHANRIYQQVNFAARNVLALNQMHPENASKAGMIRVGHLVARTEAGYDCQ